MKLSDKGYKILAEIARRPQLTKKQIAEELDISQNSVGQRIYKFREHGLVVENTGSGAVKRCERLSNMPNSADRTYTEPFENDEFEWLVTGKGETALKERREELFNELNSLEQSLRRRKVYRPSHVLD